MRLNHSIRNDASLTRQVLLLVVEGQRQSEPDALAGQHAPVDAEPQVTAISDLQKIAGQALTAAIGVAGIVATGILLAGDRVAALGSTFWIPGSLLFLGVLSTCVGTIGLWSSALRAPERHPIKAIRHQLRRGQRNRSKKAEPGRHAQDADLSAPRAKTEKESGVVSTKHKAWFYANLLGLFAIVGGALLLATLVATADRPEPQEQIVRIRFDSEK